MKKLLEIIKTWDWGNNFVLPLSVIFIAWISYPILKFLREKFLFLVKKLKYLRREASVDIFKSCILNSKFKTVRDFDSIKVLKKLRLKSLKKRNIWQNDEATDSFINFISRVYTNKYLINKRLRRKIYKTWLNVYTKIKNNEDEYYRFINGTMSYDEDIQFQKKLGLIK